MTISQDPEGSRLLYTISGDYFSVNPNSGEVTLIKVKLTRSPQSQSVFNSLLQALDRETVDRIDVVITIQVSIGTIW